MTFVFFLLLILGLAPIAITLTQDKPGGCLDRRKAAEYLSISVRLLDKLATAGEIPRVKIGTKTLFRVTDLDKFVATKVQRLNSGV